LLLALLAATATGSLLAGCSSPGTGPTPPSSALPPGTAAQVRALVRESSRIESLSTAAAAQLPTALSDNASTVYGIPDSCASATSCVYGDRAASTSIVLYGDSHARMWLGSIIPFALREHLKLILVGHDSCPVVTLDIRSSIFASCNSFRAAAVATIDQIRPVAVLLADRTTDQGISSSQWRRGMSATLSALHESGARLVVIGDIQVFNASLPDCLAGNLNHVQTCSVSNPNPQQPGEERAERAAATAAHVAYIDPTPWLCTPTSCSPVIGPYVAYWNSDHVAVTYSIYLSGVMGTALRSCIGATVRRLGAPASAHR
jgi:SGNH domain (fused to AT3 domains)